MSTSQSLPPEPTMEGLRPSLSEPVPQQGGPSYFLSYAGVDRSMATKVVKGLQEAGVTIVWDQENLHWGNNWVQSLQDMLAQCSGVIILVGRAGIRKWVQFEISIAIKWHVEKGLDLYPLLLSGVEPDTLPPYLSTLQAQKIPDELNGSAYFHQLAAELLHTASQGPKLSRVNPKLQGVCPFPGLEAFGEDRTPFFCGRQRETAEAISRFGQGLDRMYRRWLQVEGTSGVGKSSFVRAGIIPTIKTGWAGSLEASQWTSWRVIEPMRPGSEPILNLAEVLGKGLGTSTQRPSVGEINERFKQDGQALKVLLREWACENEAIVLVVDQLEELFTLTIDPQARAQFDALLSQALEDRDGPFHLITTIRSDFLIQFNDVPALHRLLNGQAARYQLLPIDRFGLKDVVETPAERVGLQWSDPEFPADIVNEAVGEPGALPLVENLLLLLWMEADRRKDYELRRGDYKELSGVGGALAKSADGLLESLGPRKPKALQLLMALVQVGGSGKDRQDARQTVPKTQALRAAGGGVEAEEVLNALSGLRGQDAQKGELARPRLVVVSQGNDAGAITDLVDLAHETLLRYTKNEEPFWPTFRNEIDRHHRAIANRQLADQLAEEWALKGRSHLRGLATWSQIRAFGRLPDLSGKALAYLRVSRWGQTIKALLLLVPVLVVLGAVTWMQKENVTPHYSWLVLQARLGWVDIIEPKMVHITGGTFQQGPTQRKDEQPVRAVVIPDFHIGQFEVTFEEYDQYVNLVGAVKLPGDEGWGRGKRPVINVNWEDAKKYARWLSHTTGKHYRLPTESEWEYAARSGAKQEEFAGTSEEAQLPEYAVYSGQSGNRTAEVGSKQENEFKLKDMSGNVWEWVEDCWHENYQGAPTDRSAWVEAVGGDCSRRVVRGGSWGNNPVVLRASGRDRGSTGTRGNRLGFRLAQGTR